MMPAADLLLLLLLLSMLLLSLLLLSLLLLWLLLCCAHVMDNSTTHATAAALTADL
jgi:hypothetical protein